MLVKRIGLLIGIILVFVSFLFFGRQQGTYNILLLSGLVTAVVFFVSILVGKVAMKTKLVWTAVVVLLVVVQQLTEPYFVDFSYRIFISQHESVLKEVNAILLQKRDEITILGDSVSSRKEQLSADEIGRLKEGREKLGVYVISRVDKGVYYGLWGFLDVRLGITYLPDGDDPGGRYRHLEGKWFR